MEIGRRGWAVIGSIAPLVSAGLLGVWLFDSPSLARTEALRRLAWWLALVALGPFSLGVHASLRSESLLVHSFLALALWSGWLVVLGRTNVGDAHPMLWIASSVAWCASGALWTGTMVT